MASSSLPVRKVLITLGQSNSTAIAPAQKFEDANPRIALRSPKAEPFARYYTESSGARDEIDLGEPFGDLRYVNYRDMGSTSVRYLTFYNPVSSRFDRAISSLNVSGDNYAESPVVSATYPGICRVTRVDTADEFATDAVWIHPQADPTLVRLRTNTTHETDVLQGSTTGRTGQNEAAGYVTLRATESFNPPLEVGERFSYVITADAASAASTDANQGTLAPVATDKNHVRLDVQFGGFADVGGVLDPSKGGAHGSAPNGVTDGYDVFENACTVGTSATNADGAVSFEYRRLRVGARVRFTFTTGTGALVYDNGTSPSPDVNVNADFYIVRVEDATFDETGTRQTAPRFWVSREFNGPEMPIYGSATDVKVRFLPRAGDYAMAGLQIRCLTGTNAGNSRYLSHAIPAAPVDNNTAGQGSIPTRSWLLYVTEDWQNTPAVDDTYTILPPDAPDGTAVPFDKWAYFLPVCQFFGREQGLPSPLRVEYHTQGVGSHWKLTDFINLTDSPVSSDPSLRLYEGCPIRLYKTAGSNPVDDDYVGKTYYVLHLNEDTQQFQLSETPGGGHVNFGGSAMHALLDWEETFTRKYNPAPPGFNYSNQQAVPLPYQPFAGGSFYEAPGFKPSTSDGSDLSSPLRGYPEIAYHWGLAQRMSERLGEPVYVIDLSVGLTSLAESVVLRQTRAGGYGWDDPASMQHWAAGLTSLRSRWLRHLDAAEIAAAREGVQLEVIGVVFVQGESHADAEQTQSSRYYTNLVGFKKFVRETLKERGWWSKESDQIPFLQPQIYPYTVNTDAVTEVRTAIKRAADEDPFSQTWDTKDYTLFDGLHYDGDGMDSMALDAFKRLDGYVSGLDIPLRICKLALALAGERAEVTSVFPSDGSPEADMCNRFYVEARDRILEAHAWDFLVRNAQLTETTNEREDWKYAYELPANCSGIIGLGEDIMSAFDNTALKIKFSVELNTQSERVLYANQPKPLAVRYKAKTVDPRHFSSTCIQAIAHLMASMIMRTVLKSEEGLKAGEAMEQRAMQTFKYAASNDANQTRDRSQSQRMGWRRS